MNLLEKAISRQGTCYNGVVLIKKRPKTVERKYRKKNSKVYRGVKKGKANRAFRVLGFCIFPLIITSLLLIILTKVVIYELSNSNNTLKVSSDYSKINSTLKLNNNSLSDPFQTRPEINSKLSFDKTNWGNVTDLSFYFKFLYPKNTSYLISNPDGLEIWLLRGNGFMFKLSIYPSTTNMLSFINKNVNMNLFTGSSSTFDGLKGYLLTTRNIQGVIAGKEYIVVYKSNLFVIWFKNEPIGSDDSLRINAIIDSFKFI